MFQLSPDTHVSMNRNAGMGNGLHRLQVQIAMRGTIIEDLW